MKKLDKIFLFIILLICFGFSVCILSLFYPVPFVHNLIESNQPKLPWLNQAFAIYSLVVSIFFLILLLIILFFPNSSDFLSLPKTKGRLQFSKKTIESTVRYSFSDLDKVNNSLVKVKIGSKPGKTKIYLKLSLNDTTELTHLTETIQEKIASALETSLGITAKLISIKVVESSPDDTEKNEFPKKSRVV